MYFFENKIGCHLVCERWCLYLVLLLSIDEFVWKISSLLILKFINEGICRHIHIPVASLSVAQYVGQSVLWLGHGLDVQWTLVHFPAMSFLICKPWRLALRPTVPHVEWIPWVRWPGLEAKFSSLSSAEIENYLRCMSIPLRVFRSCKGTLLLWQSY
jgi:hypothetical protein